MDITNKQVQQHIQARATDRVEKLTLQQQDEAKIMRVIAVLTLIYLPATFVSVCTYNTSISV